MFSLFPISRTAKNPKPNPDSNSDGGLRRNARSSWLWFLSVMGLPLTLSAQFGTNDFYAAKAIPSGRSPISIQAADLDGDGLPDLAVSNYADRTILILQNDSASLPEVGRASFSSSANVLIKLDGSAFRILLADLDGDGRVDLLAAMHNQGRVLFFKNIHMGGVLSLASFAPAEGFITPGTSGFLAAGDFDGDGLLDLAVGDSDVSKSVQILHQRPRTTPGGKVTFDAIVSLPTGDGPSDPTIADLNGDGHPELIAPDGHGSSIVVFQNRAKPGSWDASAFGPGIRLPCGVWPQTVAVGDIDGDGKPDLASVNTSPQNITFYRNVSLPGKPLTADSFVLGETLTQQKNSYAIQLLDLDRDGKLDMIAADGVGGVLRMYRNRASLGLVGATSFASPVNLSAPGVPVAYAVGDFHTSGGLDIVAVNFGGSSLALLESTLPFRPRLEVSQFAGALLLRWKTNATKFQLQQSPNTSLGPWTLVPGTPVRIGADAVMPVLSGENAGYYRLSRP